MYETFNKTWVKIWKEDGNTIFKPRTHVRIGA